MMNRRSPERREQGRSHRGDSAVPSIAGNSSSAFSDAFRRFAHRVAYWMGTPVAFVTAILIIVVWGITGPLFHFSDTWQLVINTGTTVITFLMVFLIQSTQNRDAYAIHLKLDELIRAQENARNILLALEDLTDEQLDQLEAEFRALREREVARGLASVDDAPKAGSDDPPRGT
ncbi:MAG: low affinity iron permease family protein [Polyangiaceae bacterium]